MANKLKTFIENHLRIMCDTVRVDGILLAILQGKRVISDGFSAEIDATHGNFVKNAKLWAFIRDARTDADIPIIVDALEASANAGALELFKENSLITVDECKSVGNKGVETHQSSRSLLNDIDVGVTQSSRPFSSPSIIFVSQIVEMLINDAYLVSQRTLFTDHLGIPPAERKQWEALYVMGATSGYDHFTKLIGEWVQRTTNPSLGKLKEILKSCTFMSARDSITPLGYDSTIIKIKQQSSNSPRSNVISFGVIQPTTFFTGRDAEVKQLSELFLNQRPPKIVVISGMGGQGKTELCRLFMKTLTDKNYTPALTWLSGDNATNLTSSVVHLAQDLQIPTINEGKTILLTQLLVEVADKISEANYSSSGWLVVIDNVDEVYSEFLQAVRLLVRHGAFILVTTRRTDVLSGEAKLMKLDVMKQEDAHKLVRKCLNQPPSADQDVHHLCHELGNHALALRHAVAYINALQDETRTSYGIKDYLEDFTKDMTLSNDNFVDGYEKSISLIVTQSINTICDKHGTLGKIATGLMEILCLVRPDGISLECVQKFQTILDKGSDKQVESINVGLHQALTLLKRYSLITYKDGSVISIHRLVQKAAKCHVGEAHRQLLKTITPETCSTEELQQVIHVWEQADTGTVKECPSLPDRAFIRMIELSLVLEMKTFAETNFQLFTKLFGPDDKNTLEMEHNLGSALNENGDYEAALTKSKEVLEKKKLVLGEDHPSTLITASELGSAFYKLSKFEEALAWNERVLESRLRVLGSNHKDTMATKQNTALLLHHLGRIDESLTLYNQVLVWRMENQGQFSRDTLITLNNMAIILYDQLEEAKTKLAAILKLKEEVLGEEHAVTLTTKSCLAITIWKLGRKEEALKMTQEVLASQERVLGPNHPNTVATRKRVSEWVEDSLS